MTALYDWSDMSSHATHRPPLDRARSLLEGMWMCHQDRLKRGDVGEWQTEINEVRRVLEAILEHLDTLKVK
jgi:hypothetical protein